MQCSLWQSTAGTKCYSPDVWVQQTAPNSALDKLLLGVPPNIPVSAAVISRKTPVCSLHHPQWADHRATTQERKREMQIPLILSAWTPPLWRWWWWWWLVSKKLERRSWCRRSGEQRTSRKSYSVCFPIFLVRCFLRWLGKLHRTNPGIGSLLPVWLHSRAARNFHVAIFVIAECVTAWLGGCVCRCYFACRQPPAGKDTAKDA